MDKGPVKKDAKPQATVKPNPSADRKIQDVGPGESDAKSNGSGPAAAKTGPKPVANGKNSAAKSTPPSVKASEERDSDTANDSADPGITLSPGK
jgi:hypothetical protein